VIVRHSEGIFARRSTSDPELYYRATFPDGALVAVVGILPGYGEHGKRYAHVADAWADRGIASVALDLRGHGRAQGLRGYCERFQEYIDDASELAPFLEERAGDAPLYLFGHSFGGLVAASTVLSQPAPWRGIVLSAPYFGLAMHVPRVKLLAGKIASRIAPKFALPTGIRGSDVTHDAERARAYDEDPLVYTKATARWFTETAAAQTQALARARLLTMPLYVAMGTADRVAKIESARLFFEAATSRDKKWDERPGLFHEVLAELEWRSIAGAMADWIVASCASMAVP
jgi:alpha-beta hydrolase superfamily lysophospholipase